MIKIKKVTKEDLKGTSIRAEHAYYPGISALYKALGICWCSKDKFEDFKPPFPPFSYECYGSFLTYTRYPDLDDELFPPQSEINHQWVKDHCPYIADFLEAGYTLVEGDVIVVGDGGSRVIGPCDTKIDFNAYVLYSKQLYNENFIPAASIRFDELTQEDFANTFIRKDSPYANWFIHTINDLGILWTGLGKKPLEFSPTVESYNYAVNYRLNLCWLGSDQSYPDELTEINEKWFRARFPTLNQVLKSDCKLVNGDKYISLDGGTTTTIGDEVSESSVNDPDTNIDYLLAIIKCKALNGETSENTEARSVHTLTPKEPAGVIDGIIANHPQTQPLVVGIKYTGGTILRRC